MDKKVLIFDLDGTLVNSKKSIIDAFNYSFIKNGLVKIDFNYFKKNSSKGSKFFIEKNLNKKRDILNKINNDFHHKYLNICDQNIWCRAGVRWFLNKFCQKYIFVVCTNKKKKYAKKILNKLEIKKYFYKIYGSDFSIHKKPSRNLYTEISKNLNSKGERIVIGDSEVDYEFANNCKKKFILLEDGYTNYPAKKITKNYSIANFFSLEKTINLL
jgi:HAD superfamily hydrolase (TIGR01549 family)